MDHRHIVIYSTVMCLVRTHPTLTLTAIKLRKNRCIVGAVFNRTWVV